MINFNIKKQKVLFIFCILFYSLAFSTPSYSGGSGIFNFFGIFFDGADGNSPLSGQESDQEYYGKKENKAEGNHAFSVLAKAPRRTFTTGDGMSESGAVQVANAARKAGNKIYVGSRIAIYTIAALGMIALCIMGFFGRWNWSWFFGWCFALFLIGGVQALIDLLYFGNYPNIL